VPLARYARTTLQDLSSLQRVAARPHAFGRLSRGLGLRDATAGVKAEDYRLWKSAVLLLSAGRLSDQDYRQVLALRERMNRGGKRRHRMDGILRDYTPSPPI
jgi:hypothetical protein